MGLNKFFSLKPIGYTQNDIVLNFFIINYFYSEHEPIIGFLSVLANPLVTIYKNLSLVVICQIS